MFPSASHRLGFRWWVTLGWRPNLKNTHPPCSLLYLPGTLPDVLSDSPVQLIPQDGSHIGGDGSSSVFSWDSEGHWLQLVTCHLLDSIIESLLGGFVFFLTCFLGPIIHTESSQRPVHQALLNKETSAFFLFTYLFIYMLMSLFAFAYHLGT